VSQACADAASMLVLNQRRRCASPPAAAAIEAEVADAEFSSAEPTRARRFAPRRRRRRWCRQATVWAGGGGSPPAHATSMASSFIHPSRWRGGPTLSPTHARRDILCGPHAARPLYMMYRHTPSCSSPRMRPSQAQRPGKSSGRADLLGGTPHSPPPSSTSEDRTHAARLRTPDAACAAGPRPAVRTAPAAHASEWCIAACAATTSRGRWRPVPSPHTCPTTPLRPRWWRSCAATAASRCASRARAHRGYCSRHRRRRRRALLVRRRRALRLLRRRLPRLHRRRQAPSRLALCRHPGRRRLAHPFHRAAPCMNTLTPFRRGSSSRGRLSPPPTS
jgi:hypothetical protein